MIQQWSGDACESRMTMKKKEKRKARHGKTPFDNPENKKQKPENNKQSKECQEKERPMYNQPVPAARKGKEQAKGVNKSRLQRRINRNLIDRDRDRCSGLPGVATRSRKLKASLLPRGRILIPARIPRRPRPLHSTRCRLLRAPPGLVCILVRRRRYRKPAHHA